MSDPEDNGDYVLPAILWTAYLAALLVAILWLVLLLAPFLVP